MSAAPNSASPALPVANVFRTYYRLTKPGIIYGNVITAAAGFFLAAHGSIQFGRFLATLFGTSLVIAAACVTNNYIDRDIDKRMDRTKKRAIPLGSVSGRSALLYATLLGVSGFSLLAMFVNGLTVAAGAVGVVFYVALYAYAKRHSVYGTEVGSVSGAVPVMAGYMAAAGRFDMGALLVFIVLVFWQMPHFHAIALYRKKDYANAGLPVLPVVKGARTTKIRIIAYIILCGLAACALTVAGYTGYTYLTLMVVMTGIWLWRGLRGFKAADDAAWGRMMFGFSLLVLLAFSFGISLTQWLP